jgi:peptide/nickel transport system substrate-binding protein
MRKFALLAAMLFAEGVQVASAKELRFSIPGDPKSFDPLHIEESNSQIVRYLTAGVLVRINRVTDQLEPELAESWSLKNGGREIVFRLRSDLRFSDGSPLMAADVAKTLKRAFDPKEASPAGDTFRVADGYPDVRAAGRDVIIAYKKPKANLDRLFDQLGIPGPASGRFFATAGPFIVAEYHAGDYIRLVRNPRYWKRDASGRALPYLDSIRIDIQQNRDLELARFLRGESHLIHNLDPEAFDRVAKEQPAASHDLGVSLDSEFLWFNEAPAQTLPEWKRRWFTSPLFRRAISEAIQRNDLSRVAYRGHAHPAFGPISPANHFWFFSALKPLSADAKTALNDLLKAGFKLDHGVLMDSEGHRVEFSIVTNSNNRPRQRIAQLVQEDLAKIGIKVNIVTLDFGSMVERISKTLDYEAAILGFSNVEVDPLEEMNFWLSSGVQHPWWPAEKTPATAWEAEIDRLELAQSSEISRESRRKAIDEMQRIVSEQQPIVYLLNPDYLCAYSSALRGVQPAVAPPQILWNIEWLRLE